MATNTPSKMTVTTEYKYRNVSVVASEDGEIQVLYLNGRKVRLDSTLPSMAAILKAVGLAPSVIMIDEDDPEVNIANLPDDLSDVKR